MTALEDGFPVPTPEPISAAPAQTSLETSIAQLRAQLNKLEQQVAALPQPATVSTLTPAVSVNSTSRRSLLKRFGLAAAGVGAALNLGPGKTVQAESSNLVSTGAIPDFSGSLPANQASIKRGPVALAAALAAKVTGNLLVTGNLTATSPFLLVPGLPSAITTGTHSQGELFTDTNGDFYICKTAGSPGIWTKLTPSVAGASSIVLLTMPVRLIGPNNSLYTPYPGGYPPVNNVASSYFPIAGSWTITNPAGTISVTIPSNATGVIGTVSVINSIATGRLMIFSADAPASPAPDFSSLNFTNDSKSWSSGFISRLGPIPSGPNVGTKGIAVLTNQASSVFIGVDIVGYMV